MYYFYLIILIYALLLIIPGFFLSAWPPKLINLDVSNRTHRSLKSADSWYYSTARAGRLMMVCGLLLIPIGVFINIIVFELLISLDINTLYLIICFAQVALLLAMFAAVVFKIEYELGFLFDENGVPNDEKHYAPTYFRMNAREIKIPSSAQENSSASKETLPQKPKRGRFQSISSIISLVLLAASAVFVAVFWRDTGGLIASHYDFSGLSNDYSSTYFLLVLIGVWALILFALRFVSLKSKNQENPLWQILSSIIISVSRILVSLVFSYIIVCSTLSISLGGFFSPIFLALIASIIFLSFLLYHRLLMKKSKA